MKTTWGNAKGAFIPVHAPVISGDLPLPGNGAAERCNVKRFERMKVKVSGLSLWQPVHGFSLAVPSS